MAREKPSPSPLSSSTRKFVPSGSSIYDSRIVENSTKHPIPHRDWYNPCGLRTYVSRIFATTFLNSERDKQDRLTIVEGDGNKALMPPKNKWIRLLDTGEGLLQHSWDAHPHQYKSNLQSQSRMPLPEASTSGFINSVIRLLWKPRS